MPIINKMITMIKSIVKVLWSKVLSCCPSLSTVHPPFVFALPIHPIGGKERGNFFLIIPSQCHTQSTHTLWACKPVVICKEIKSTFNTLEINFALALYSSPPAYLNICNISLFSIPQTTLPTSYKVNYSKYSLGARVNNFFAQIVCFTLKVEIHRSTVSTDDFYTKSISEQQS